MEEGRHEGMEVEDVYIASIYHGTGKSLFLVEKRGKSPHRPKEDLSEPPL